jgi:hypothetical protein
MSYKRLTAYGVALLITLATLADASAKEPPYFPSTWINSEPMTVEGLKGKLVILWFYVYEPTKPAARYPRNRPPAPGDEPDKEVVTDFSKNSDLAEAIKGSKAYQGKPVIFIAVNSKNDLRTVQQSGQILQIPWPMIADPDQSYTREVDVDGLNNENINQVMIITPDGSLEKGDWTNVDSTINAYLEKASWKIDPSEMPKTLRTTWQLVELGFYGKAMAGIKRYLRSRDEASKAAAQKLNDIVNKDLDGRLSAAKALSSWESYKYLVRFVTEFGSFPQGRAAKEELKKLSKDKQVKRELLAKTVLEKINFMLYGKPSKTTNRNRRKKEPNGNKQIEEALWKLVKEYDDTEAGKKAAGVLAKLAP